MSEDYYVPGKGASSRDPEPDAAPRPRVITPQGPASDPATPAAGAPEALPRKTRGLSAGAKTAVAACAVALVAAIGAGAFLLPDGGDDPTAPMQIEPAAVISGPSFSFNVDAAGFDPLTSTPFVVTAVGTTSAGGVVNASHAVGAGTSTWELGEGSYTFSVIPAVNADGSTYAVASPLSPSADGAVAISASKVAARDVTASQAARIVSALESASARGDSTVPPDAAARAESYLPDAPETVASGGQAGSQAQAECSHEWEVSTKNGKEVWIDGAPVYGDGEPIIEYHDMCSCGIDLTDAGQSSSYHLSTHGSQAYSVSKDVPVVVGYEQVIVEYEQVFAGYQQVADGYVCAKCGEKKEVE